MKKYNLSLAVMRDDEPIMFIYSKDYNKDVRRFLGDKHGVHIELARLFPVLNFHLIKGIDNGMDYCEYSCSPDAERGDMKLLAIWQKI